MYLPQQSCPGGRRRLSAVTGRLRLFHMSVGDLSVLSILYLAAVAVRQRQEDERALSQRLKATLDTHDSAASATLVVVLFAGISVWVLTGLIAKVSRVYFAFTFENIDDLPARTAQAAQMRAESARAHETNSQTTKQKRTIFSASIIALMDSFKAQKQKDQHRARTDALFTELARKERAKRDAQEAQQRRRRYVPRKSPRTRTDQNFRW